MATRFELRHAPLTRVTAFAAPTIEFLLFGIIVAYGDTSPESAAAFASLLMIASLLHSWFVFGSRYELNSSTLRIVHGPWRRAVPLADMLGARPLRTLDRGAIRAAPPRLQARAPPHATRSRCVPRRARGAGPLPRGARDRVRNPVPELAPRSPRSREPGTPTRGGFVIPAGWAAAPQRGLVGGRDLHNSANNAEGTSASELDSLGIQWRSMPHSRSERGNNRPGRTLPRREPAATRRSRRRRPPAPEIARAGLAARSLPTSAVRRGY